ncbi:MAG: hypothetical protein H6581_29390 [Bacteroidia bacterium]|nr:hypothetical protein [Bacteroidia bacterium]
MASSIESYLRNLSYKFYLKRDAKETARIRASTNKLFSNLDSELGDVIDQRFIFGSYDRDTILPRVIDKKSDVDIMVIFNHSEYDRTPETYRSWLKRFGDKYYKNRYGSKVLKSFPTVTIQLGTITFDLVPAKEETSFWSGTKIYIPDNTYGWQATDPDDVKAKLTQSNTRHNQIVRPIIRLLKAWNSTNGYPFDSYLLELMITGMNFKGDNIQSGLFYAVQKLNLSRGDSQARLKKLDSLKYNISNVEDCLNNDNPERAKHWLHRVLPKL